MTQSVYIRRIMRDSIRMYFAPLIGAFKGISAELRRADMEVQRERNAEFQAKKEALHNA